MIPLFTWLKLFIFRTVWLFLSLFFWFIILLIFFFWGSSSSGYMRPDKVDKILFVYSGFPNGFVVVSGHSFLSYTKVYKSNIYFNLDPSYKLVFLYYFIHRPIFRFFLKYPSRTFKFILAVFAIFSRTHATILDHNITWA